MKKKSLIAFLFVFTFLLGNAFSTNSVLAGETVESLKKQVTQLKAQVKTLTTKITSKDQEIAKLKKENQTLKANAATVSKTKVAYKGLVKTGAITYKNNEYIPVSYVKDVFGIPVTYDRKADINYVGGKPTGSYMSDIMKPYYGRADLNETMIMGQQSYYKGYRFTGDGELNFNLNKKYSTITGKIGIDDQYDAADTTIKVYGDGELLRVFEFKKGDLPIDINLDVINVSKLQFISSSHTYFASVIDFADFIIK